MADPQKTPEQSADDSKRKKEIEETKAGASKAWGQAPTLGNEITPSDVLKQQEKK